MVAHYNPSNQEAEEGKFLWVSQQQKLHSEIVSKNK